MPAETASGLSIFPGVSRPGLTPRDDAERVEPTSTSTLARRSAHRRVGVAAIAVFLVLLRVAAGREAVSAAPDAPASPAQTEPPASQVQPPQESLPAPDPDLRRPGRRRGSDDFGTGPRRGAGPPGEGPQQPEAGIAPDAGVVPDAPAAPAPGTDGALT